MTTSPQPVKGTTTDCYIIIMFLNCLKTSKILLYVIKFVAFLTEHSYFTLQLDKCSI